VPSECEPAAALNSTFTLDDSSEATQTIILTEPTLYTLPLKAPSVPCTLAFPPTSAPMPVITQTAEEKLQELFRSSQGKVQNRSSRPTERPGNKRKARASMIPNPSNIPSRSTRGNLVTPFKSQETMVPQHKKMTMRRVVHSSESEQTKPEKGIPFRRVPLPSKSPLRTTIKSNSSIKKSSLKTPTRVRSKSPNKGRSPSPGGQRSQSK